MEPSSPQPNNFPERAPQQGAEYQAPRQAETAPAPERTIESREQLTGAGVGDAAPTQAVPLPPPMPAAPAAIKPVVPAQPHDDAPLIAADDDLIEKEWVDKAKKIINETKHDPYLQEQAFAQLQSSYLQKRYGKTIKHDEA